MESCKWYVLRAAQPLKAVERMKELRELEHWSSAFQELRAPIRYVAPKDRAAMKKDHPMVFNYIFCLARLGDISAFLGRYPELKTWVLNRRWKETDDKGFSMVAPSVSSVEIERFFRICDAIAKVEAHYVPFMNVQQEDFQPGDLVKVKGGLFDGQSGYLIDRKENTVVLKMMDGLGAPVKIEGAELEQANIPGVRNIKFALFDRFFEQAPAILKHLMADTLTSDDLAFALHSLSESEKLTDLSPKLQSKQLILQLVCHTLLNNRKQAQRALEDCHCLLPRIKDRNQRAQQAVYAYLCRPMPDHYQQAQDALRQVTGSKQKEYETLLSLLGEQSR